MKFLPILAAIVLLALAVGSVAALAEETAPCTLAQAKSAEQARIQATCVKAKTTLADKAARRHEGGYRLRVDANACSKVDDPAVIYRCRFHGFVGDLGCRGVVRTYGDSRDPAALRARLTYLRCVR